MTDIKYALRGITITQFATVFEPATDDIGLNVEIPIKTNYKEHSVAIGANIRFTENGNAFLIMEVFCHYVIEQECWRELSAEDTNDVKLPKRLINNLVAIAISTARGALCAKTENTPFSKFFLPVIMITPEKVEDLMIMKQSANEE